MASISNPVVATDIHQRWDARTLAGAGLIFIASLTHAVLAPEHFGGSPYVGALFAAEFAGAMAAAIGISTGAYWGRRWGWTLGVLVALGVFAAYFFVPGFPGAGAIAKTVETLFLIIVGFKVAGSFTGFRRWLLVSGIAAVLVVPVLAVALGFLAPGSAQAGPGLPVKWKATSPATNPGDQYSLVVTNTGNEAQWVGVNATVVDHSTKTKTTLINKQIELAPGEERELTATNDYGRGMHTMTQLGSETRDLGLSARLTDSSGKETAQYNQEAFLVQKGKQKAGGKTNGG